MVIVNQNEAKKLPVMLIDSSDHLTAKTGVIEDNVTVKISKNLGAFTNLDLTGKWSELGYGVYLIHLSASDLDTVGFLSYVVMVSRCDQYSGMVYVDAARATETKQDTITELVEPRAHVRV